VRIATHYLSAETGQVELFIASVSSCHSDVNPDPECSQPVESPPSMTQEQQHWSTGQHNSYRYDFMTAVREGLGIPD
jgi:hypothetical protein